MVGSRNKGKHAGTIGALCFALLGTFFFSAPSFAQATNALARPQSLKAVGIENFYQLSGRVFSGSTPEGEAGFAALTNRGIRTIISVDGAKPDIETARKFGLRYVHLPISYDSVPGNQAAKMVKAAQVLAQPVYVHCHQGLHRGPAAAAVICESLENWTPDQAVDWLKQAGTATNYSGLYRSVAQFRPPTAAELQRGPSDFAEKSEVSAMVDAMVAIDERFNHLKLVAKAEYKAPPSHPDITPAHEALLLHELFRELLRSTEMTKYPPGFLAKMQEAEQASGRFHTALSASPAASSHLAEAFRQINASCADCHKVFRN